VNPVALTAALKEEALRLGFCLAGACPAVDTPEVERLHAWLAAGRAGQMHYFADRASAYAHPRSVLDGVRSLLMLAMNYRTQEPAAAETGTGRVARYAWGADYHDLIHDRLRQLARFHQRLAPDAAVRGVVDTAPLMERQFARLAGLGWQGKNTLLLNRELGSWFFLAALLTSEELDYDRPFAADHCGTCRACLDACPTEALVAPYQLDARRCISYLTIELRQAAQAELRGQAGPWVFGCDVCQEVCPWNHRAPASAEPAFEPAEDRNPASLAELLELGPGEFSQRFRHTPLARPKRRGLLRNAAIALGNCPHPPALPALVRALADADPLVRGACAWALGRYAEPAARAALESRLALEDDPAVRDEITAALGT
jgi:epoxyqueuosine reductase